MNPIFIPLLQALHQAAQQAGFKVELGQIQLEKTKTLAHGHLASNVALMLSKQMGQAPLQAAEAMLAQVSSPLIQRAEVAGPGFINFFIEQKFYTEKLHQLLQDPDLFLKTKDKRTLLIDYSHPNIAKPMGVHHLLSTIIGDSIKKLYRQRGWTVIADNFIGDMGTQFGKLMYAIKAWGDPEAIEKDPITELQKLYVQFHVEAEEDESLDQEGRAEYKKFEEGDLSARHMWEKIREWSLKEIQPLYDRLGIEFDCMNGESFYEEKMLSILKRGREEGVFIDGEQGAWIVAPENPEGTPVVIRKSDGTTLYITRDLARIEHWEKTWHPDLMVTVVDSAQSFHFEQLFYTQKKLGLTQAENIHVSFGRMEFKDGKMSTRKGNIILLNQVLEEAVERALALVKERTHELNEKEERELARKMGINSIKYNVLSQNRTSNLTFDWDKMLSFEGNSAPYLMYTLARAKSVLRKSGLTQEEISSFSLEKPGDPEMKVLLQLLIYPETLNRAVEEFKPNHLAHHLYELAQDYNHFYNGNSILQAETQALKHSRLLLSLAVVEQMELAFEALGLEGVERM